jgi:molybdenum-dependent DNA-binding transcriptional regulator ModE
MADVELKRVSIFVRVVEAGSFSAAATALGLPTSSVSRSVASLEESMGVSFVLFFDGLHVGLLTRKLARSARRD